MYANAKMIPVPGIGGREMKESSGGGEFKYLIHSKKLCKCYNVPTLST
jgi:hypothetical protein